VALPERVRILHLPGDHTGSIGSFAEGAFIADTGPCYPSSSPGPGSGPHDLAASALHYLVLHLFDHDGAHLRSDLELHPWEGTDIGACGCARRPRSDRQSARWQAVSEALPDRRTGDVAVRPFRFRREGVDFGLFDESGPGRGDVAVLYPGGLTFRPPWLGDYECHHRAVPGSTPTGDGA